MTNEELVKSFITALQSGDFDLAATLMSDDFIAGGFTPDPLDKGEFLAMQSELHDAMPDYDFHFSDIQEHDNGTEALIQITGTHNRDLELAMFGLPLIPATGLAIDLPQVHTQYRVSDGKIAEIRFESVPGSGLPGLLQQIGTELPILPRLGTEDITRLNESGDTSI